MFKRALWLTTGAAFGFGSSIWVTRWAKDVAARYTPTKLTIDAASTAKTIGRGVRDAVAEGRVAMREREAELRADVEGRVLTPELELRLRAELIDRALPPELRAEIIRQAIPPELEAALLEHRLTPELEGQLRRELAERRGRQPARQIGRSSMRRIHRRRLSAQPHGAIEAAATED